LEQLPFWATLVRWQVAHGRNDLPWQNTGSAYAVWLSEIMLQQTQVVTVRGYFARFVARFPHVAALASASLDDVLGLWSGLGYYSRARNMHQCAQAIMAHHGGVFPSTAAELQTLPGIGPSTAAAIASLCFGERVAIMDGNVKRVLTRYLGYDSDLAVTANSRRLMQLATDLLPDSDLPVSMARYTQGIMDMGATVCTTRKPACEVCPQKEGCRARALGAPERFPVKTRKLKRTAESIWLLSARTHDGAVWLSKRPTPGVWAGLYCLPLFSDRAGLQAVLPAQGCVELAEEVAIKHVLTHKDLYLHPVSVVLSRESPPDSQGVWVDHGQWVEMGLPAPIRKWLSCERRTIGSPSRDAASV